MSEPDEQRSLRDGPSYMCSWTCPTSRNSRPLRRFARKHSLGSNVTRVAGSPCRPSLPWGEKGHRHGSGRRRHPDQSFVTNSEGSEEYIHQRREEGGRDAGATTTRVQDDTGERLVLRFEIAIVKIPLLSLHGIQFKKVQGGMNQYRSMTATILSSLRL